MVPRLSLQKVMVFCLMTKKKTSEVCRIIHAGRELRRSLVLSPAHSRARLLRDVSGEVLKTCKDA